MSYRLFEDSKRNEWQVWDVVPQLEERRVAAQTERRMAIKVVEFADRRRTSRRLANTRRGLLRGSFAQGWLCFESSGEKRRLSPIPGDWTTCDDDALESYLHEGQRVSIPSQVIAFDSEDPPEETPGRFAEAG